ncbi:MAG: acetylornithine transaminase [Myxococcota bacterium]|nr:acetylornithine transaminase [Myxococcota bacterium]
MSTLSQVELAALAESVLTPNYKPAPVVFERGNGVWLYDVNGKRYLDFAAGIAVCALGHGHPALTKAISQQAESLLHVSNLYLNKPAIELAQRLTEISFADRVYFSNSGAESNEAALKLARRYLQVVRGEGNRSEFVSTTKSFHGRTWAAISATGQPKYHKGFGPLVPGFTHVPYSDLEAMKAAVGPNTCAIIVEPIQGEGGVVVPDEGYLLGLRQLCDDEGILLIFDEVQTGIARTGHWFAYQHSGVCPDIITLAKGLGGGVPIGAMMCSETVAHGFQPGVHATTYGGNPLVCRAALAVLDTIEADGLLSNSAEQGDYLAAGLQDLVDDFDGLLSVRGRGLMRGIGVDPAIIDRAAIVSAARDMGLLLTTAGADALRLVPPLILGSSHVDEAVSLLRQALEEVC